MKAIRNAVLTEITPELAEKLIAAHIAANPPDGVSERRHDITAIRVYADDMRHGEWDPEYPWLRRFPINIVGPKGLKLGEDWFPPNTIFDGWHRLNAIRLSRVTIWCYMGQTETP